MDLVDYSKDDTQSDYRHEESTVTTVASNVELAITPLTGSTGAEIRGVSLHEPLQPVTVAEVRQALFEYKVIFFPGQHLSTDEHFAFAAHFGEITEGHPTSAADHGRWGLDEINYTEIREAYAGHQDPNRKPRRDGWHTDVTFMETPPMGSIFNALAMPERGGDTVFANTQAAYEGLSAPFHEFLDGLVAIHDGEAAFGQQIRANGCPSPRVRSVLGPRRTSASARPAWR
jgi:taurine dioxygenase